MTTEKYIKLGRQTALFSFVLGTAILGLYYQTSWSELLFVGYIFIMVFGVANVGVLIAILLRASKDHDNSGKLLATSGLMALNIPVVVLYFWVVTILLDTMRITFTNPTQARMTDINVVGCGGGYIEKLEVGESQTVWVDITGDCSIGIAYSANGQRKSEVVVGYVTSSMGQKMKHNIGGQNGEQF